jgi:hypothetical protein
MSNNMYRTILLVYLIFWNLVSFGQGAFQIENNNFVFINIYTTKSESKELEKFLASTMVSNLRVYEGGFLGEIINTSVDLKPYGEKNPLLFNGPMKANFQAQIKEGKYRVIINNFVWNNTINGFNLNKSAEEIFIKNGRFKKNWLGHLNAFSQLLIDHFDIDLHQNSEILNDEW